MPSSLTINVSAGAAGLVSPNAQQIAAAKPVQQTALTPDQAQLARASQIAAEKVSAGTRTRSKNEGVQIPKRLEPNFPTYKRKKKPGPAPSTEEAEPGQNAQGKGNDAPLDVEA